MDAQSGLQLAGMHKLTTGRKWVSVGCLRAEDERVGDVSGGRLGSPQDRAEIEAGCE